MGARFLLLSIACFALMILDHRDQHVERVREALSVVVMRRHPHANRHRA